MFALYEENGDFKLGTILTEADSSLQIESQHGKRQKVKPANVLLRFREPSLTEFARVASAVADELDIDFLWEASGEHEFGFEDLARDYFGRVPNAPESAGILYKLHAAPIYFHRKGRGRYRAAPQEILKAALAAVEKKRLQGKQIEEWARMLANGKFPEVWRPLLRELLYKPDRNRIETKALEQACAETGLSAAKLLERCGALPSTHDYHLGRFLFEYFPRGTAFSGGLDHALPTGLPVANIEAFSLDDATTTEIDDAFSVRQIDGGLIEVGIHIAAPALGFTPESMVDRIARERLSTVYMPGHKITMLPDAVVAAFTLAQGDDRPAISLYVQIDAKTMAIRQTYSRIEAIPVKANLRHHEIESLNDALPSGKIESTIPFAAELQTLYALALNLEEGRGQAGQTFDRPEYTFHVVDDRISITERKRGSPLDKLVAEMMILANRTWGKLLADHDIAAIYRAQSQGKVRMTTAPAEHQGLGVGFYAWSSSPLRRYIDLINQWQLAALLNDELPPFQRNSATLLGAIREFELAYAAYAEFQDRMEQYWCLRWLQQEKVVQCEASVAREGVVKLRAIPLYVRMSSLPDLPPGTPVIVEVESIDLVDSTVRAVYKSRVGS
jgi:exoribonuclease II